MLSCASGASDNTIRLWDLSGKSPTVVLEAHEHSVLALTVHPDGRPASGSFRDTIYLWPILPRGQAVVDYAKSAIPRCLSPNERDAVFLGSEAVVAVVP